MSDGDGDGDRPSIKVARLIREYELDGLGEELEAAWTGDGVERKSLRDLADEFNRRLLERALHDAGRQALETEVETIYRTLTSDDVSAGVRADARNRLAADGVDVDALESDFVSYAAVRTYLTDYRGASYEGPSDAEKLDSDRDTVQRLVTRTHSVAESRLEQLRETGRLEVEEFDVFVSAEVLCRRCGTRHTVDELLDAGGCDCLLEEGAAD